MSGRKGNPGIMLKPGTLQMRLTEATRQALHSGALLPIPTEYTFIEDRGVKFFVRILACLAQKDEERKKRAQEASGGRPANPFLPYEPGLFVADISGSHVAILNKFNVVERHLLVVTREFEDQEELLTLADFEALCACMREYDSLGFYNGGEAAGASQRHKHLQVVPLPLAPEGPAVPMEALFPDLPAMVPGDVPGLPFAHAYMPLDPAAFASPGAAAERIYFLYGEMLRAVGMGAPLPGREVRQSAPYCLLVTRGWMLLVPRSREFFEGISINSLGYAGALLVRNQEQMEVLEKHGPMAVLASVGVPRP